MSLTSCVPTVVLYSYPTYSQHVGTSFPASRIMAPLYFFILHHLYYRALGPLLGWTNAATPTFAALEGFPRWLPELFEQIYTVWRMEFSQEMSQRPQVQHAERFDENSNRFITERFEECGSTDGRRRSPTVIFSEELLVLLLVLVRNSSSCSSVTLTSTL